MKNKIFYLIVSTLIILAGCSEDTIEENGVGRLTGTVVAKTTNTPLENIKIVTSPASSTVFTDASGNFVIETISVGEYSVQAESDIYADAFEAVSILNNETSSVVFELEVSKSNNIEPLVPELLTPTDGASNLEPNIQFIWSSSESDTDEITYKFQLRNGTTNEILSREVVADTTITIENLNLGTNYFWQVSASDDNSEVQSTVSQFSTNSTPQNTYFYVRSVNGNSVIYSGSANDDDQGSDDQDNDDVNFNEFKLTSESFNSFRPHKNNETSKIAFLRTVNGATQLHTMNLDGSGIKQVTNTIPVNGFRIDEIDYTWAQNGGKLYYPSFDKLYSIDPDGGGSTLIYKTTDGSFISEVSASEFDDNLIAVKTNNNAGYSVRVYTVRLSSGTEERVIFQNGVGAVKGIDLNANGTQLVYSKDTSGSQNEQYRQFSSRIYIYNLNTGVERLFDNGAVSGSNDIQPRWSPSEGAIIFTRKPSNINSVPNVLVSPLSEYTSDNILFTNASMPDWEE
ncbi:carboxypeptidase regulatory-like domain-containing protein [Leeuwenhoekiella aequorea]|uniref:carboxypeptidase regulatory-like domain-containing protein n=1 Tax=Leeuwenhoekiella aequorea TaxID=283736 RepID=UPI00352E5553